MASKAAPAEPANAPDEALIDRLANQAVAARENNASDTFMDGRNRHWFTGCENVSNNAHVLIQVRKGQDVREVYIRADAFTPEAARSAAISLDGALQ